VTSPKVVDRGLELVDTIVIEQIARGNTGCGRKARYRNTEQPDRPIEIALPEHRESGANEPPGGGGPLF
jgi:hypothetical protein